MPSSSPRTAQTQTVVVGSGAAGLAAALRLGRLGPVHLLTKARLRAGSTPLAQGGIAVAVDGGDSTDEHLEDTLATGCGLGDESAARAVTGLGPHVLTWLSESGVRFDRGPDGRPQLGREGGHGRHRIVHSGGDATGAAIADALSCAVAAHPRITVVENAFLLDVLTDRDDRIAGVACRVGDEPGDECWFAAAHVVLATGGYANIISPTTNPQLLTADGAACALRAGAVLCDMEFVQFHPTTLWLGSAAHTGSVPLISEAVRGEGAILVGSRGERLMQGVHPLADLAPRDVVARTIDHHLRHTGARHVWLDGRGLGRQGWQSRFPTIWARCTAEGIDPATDRIPVIPAAHYSCGGVRVDLAGRTGRPGLYAIGEASCTGLHGANRLASNSLLEAVAFGHMVADGIARDSVLLPQPGLPERAAFGRSGTALPADARSVVQEAVSNGCGIVRSRQGLEEALTALAAVPAGSALSAPRTELENGNLHLVAQAVILSALARRESRGCHYRSDFPETGDQRWRGHVSTRMTQTGLETGFDTDHSVPQARPALGLQKVMSS